MWFSLAKLRHRKVNAMMSTQFSLFGAYQLSNTPYFLTIENAELLFSALPQCAVVAAWLS